MAAGQRQITLGTTYYNNPHYLLKFIDHNLPHVDELIIVDDGSPVPASNYIKPSVKLKLYRVTQDYGFNSHGCRNLIMKESSNDWVTMIDIDRQFEDPEFAFSLFKNKRLQNNVLYRFEAYINSYSTIHRSVNDFLINRNHFFSAGGYDEELIGCRDGDRQYFQQLLNFGSEQLIHGVILELMRPSSITIKSNGLPQVSSHDKRVIPEHIKNLIRRRIVSPDPNKPILTFDWERVF